MTKLNPTGKWQNYIPLDSDVQVGLHFDTNGCGGYSLVHKAEIRNRFLYNQFWEFSEREQVVMSGTDPHNGNTLVNETIALQKFGLVLAKDWPELLYSNLYSSVQLSEYFKPVPKDILKKAWSFDIQVFRKITPQEVDDCLIRDTTWAIIKTASGKNHIIPRLSNHDGKFGLGQYYDSYEIRIKDFQPAEPITSEYEFIINQKVMIEFVQNMSKSGEYGLLVTSPVNVTYTPASTAEDLIARGGTSVPLKTDGTVDYTKARQITL